MPSSWWTEDETEGEQLRPRPDTAFMRTSVRRRWVGTRHAGGTIRQSDSTAQRKNLISNFPHRSVTPARRRRTLARRHSISDAQRETSVSSKPKSQVSTLAPLAAVHRQSVAPSPNDTHLTSNNYASSPRLLTRAYSTTVANPAYDARTDQIVRIRRGVAPGSPRIVHSFGLHAHYSRVANRD